MLTLIADLASCVDYIPYICVCPVDGHLVTAFASVFDIHAYAFLMGVYGREWFLGHRIQRVYSALGTTGRAISFQFWNNCIGSSLLPADDCDIDFQWRRLRQELYQEPRSVCAWLCPVCSQHVKSSPDPRDRASCGEPFGFMSHRGEGMVSLAKLLQTLRGPLLAQVS